jgi:hypothetical protein
VLVGHQRAKYDLDVERAGEVVVISPRDSWQAYYWWFDDQQAPPFARTVDIHAKPGYDPVELHFDRLRGSIPLDASLVKGSHGAPPHDPDQQTVFLCSQSQLPLRSPMTDRDVFTAILAAFGITPVITAT